MRNRAEIGYLTILGLSLTVVLTVCKENKPDKPALTMGGQPVKSHRIQMVPASLSDLINGNWNLSSKGSCFLFADSQLFTNPYVGEVTLQPVWQLIDRVLTDGAFLAAESVVFNLTSEITGFSKAENRFLRHRIHPFDQIAFSDSFRFVIARAYANAQLLHCYPDVENTIAYITSFAPTRAGPAA